MPKASSSNKVLGSQSDSDVNRIMTSKTTTQTAVNHPPDDPQHPHHHHHHHHQHPQQLQQQQQQQQLGAIQIGSAWFQKRVSLRPQHRGVHLVTEEILRQVPELDKFAIGLCHILIVHTSASLAINESWDPDVRDDMEMMLNRIVPEGLPFRHSCEGPDDMPAHVKACFLGSSLTIPISDGKLNLGTWQGIWLCEHRNQAGSRKLIVTLNGCLKPAATTTAAAAINTSSIRSPLSPTSPPPSSGS